MDFNKLKSKAQQQLQDPKKRAQVQKLVGTAKDKIASRRGKPASTDATPTTPTTTTTTMPPTAVPTTVTQPATSPRTDETPTIDTTPH